MVCAFACVLNEFSTSKSLLSTIKLRLKLFSDRINEIKVKKEKLSFPEVNTNAD